MRALCLHNITHIRDPSIIVYMPTRGCLSFFFFFFLFLHDALSQLGLGHQNETEETEMTTHKLGSKWGSVCANILLLTWYNVLANTVYAEMCSSCKVVSIIGCYYM